MEALLVETKGTGRLATRLVVVEGLMYMLARLREQWAPESQLVLPVSLEPWHEAAIPWKSDLKENFTLVFCLLLPQGIFSKCYIGISCVARDPV